MISKNQDSPNIHNSLLVLQDNKLTVLPKMNILQDRNYSDDELDDETWVAKKKEYWKKNNISPLKIKGGSISPEELSKLLAETFDKK